MTQHLLQALVNCEAAALLGRGADVRRQFLLSLLHDGDDWAVEAMYRGLLREVRSGLGLDAKRRERELVN